jgi:hypothetical protein
MKFFSRSPSASPETVAVEPGKADEIPAKVQGVDSVATPDSLHSDAAADRVAFLSSFSPEEDKAIMRKVDRRFLWLIGMMYIIKNVSSQGTAVSMCRDANNQVDRLFKCSQRQSPTIGQAFEYLGPA